jgi:hypothetical protein
VLVERRALVPQIVRPHDRRVAAGIAAAEPALLEHGDIGDAVVFRQIVSGRQAVAAAADDDCVVARLRFGIAPQARPLPVAAQGMAGQRKNRIFGHGGWRLSEPFGPRLSTRVDPITLTHIDMVRNCRRRTTGRGIRDMAGA